MTTKEIELPTKDILNEVLLPFNVKVVGMKIVKDLVDKDGSLYIKCKIIPPPKEKIPTCKFYVTILSNFRMQQGQGVKDHTFYTVMGADNIHHAYNKATKLYGGNWSAVLDTVPDNCTYVPVKKFGAIVKEIAKQS